MGDSFSDISRSFSIYETFLTFGQVHLLNTDLEISNYKGKMSVYLNIVYILNR